MLQRLRMWRLKWVSSEGVGKGESECSKCKLWKCERVTWGFFLHDAIVMLRSQRLKKPVHNGSVWPLAWQDLKTAHQQDGKRRFLSLYHLRLLSCDQTRDYWMLAKGFWRLSSLVGWRHDAYSGKHSTFYAGWGIFYILLRTHGIPGGRWRLLVNFIAAFITAAHQEWSKCREYTFHTLNP